MMYSSKNPLNLLILLCLLLSCNGKNAGPTKEAISQLYLKRGEIVSCGLSGNQFGSVDFEMTCDKSASKDFGLAMELLHSFEYDEAEKAFAKVIDQTPGCAMAYWGVAMSNFHPLWSPPSEPELRKGSMAVSLANGITQKSEREKGYVDAIGAYYKDWDKTPHTTRCRNFRNAMEKLHSSYPKDKEAAIFYALSLVASAEPTDKTYANQLRAGSILNSLYPDEPNHPGIIHYIIHTYDYPELASLGLSSARKYAGIAPSSAHALHMPSHIFTRLGLWDEDIKSNKESVAAAQCYAESSRIGKHWDEELHGMDYLVYAYLQKGDNAAAIKQLDYLRTIDEVKPTNFKVAYAFASIPSRVALENKNWKAAAALQPQPSIIPWKNFPWQEAIIHFTRLLGAANLGNKSDAQNEWNRLRQLRDTLQQQKDFYKARQVEIQLKTGEAWIAFRFGDRDSALVMMNKAADMEDSTEKHAVTPGSVLPARELLADMLLQTTQYAEALREYEKTLKNCPGRFNSLYGAGRSAEKSGNKQKAVQYYTQLANTTVDSLRPELTEIKRSLTLLNH